MRISKSTVIILISMVLIAIFLTNVVNLLSTDARSNSQTAQASKNEAIQITETSDHLLWFLQISDLHISIFQDPFRISDFKDFCYRTVDAIKPPIVLASGDLTDAKTRDSIGSQQFEKEWQYYRNILNECNIQEKTNWLDIRGNHDNFNVAGPDSKQNFFQNYSMQGHRNPRSYMHQVTKGGDLYSFIGIDACLEPGPRRPFNFIGMLDQVEVDEINSILKKSQHTGSKFNVWFGHFPTSCILSTAKEGVRDLIGKDDKALVYVCGHLHTLGGMVPRMHTLQKKGFLELELGDWKDNRVYRLLAIDHGMLSFVDVPHGAWPVVLVTNPKHVRFVNTAKENLDNIIASSHIRILAFSLGEIEFVKARIDGGTWEVCYLSKGPLYVLRWRAKAFSEGIHHIEVHVRDKEGREKFVFQPFAMDDSRLSFDLMSRIILMTDASTIFCTMFFVCLVFCILPLVVLRVVHQLMKARKLPKLTIFGRGQSRYCKLWLRKFCILATVDRIFWPIIMYPIYLAIGPWSVGYLVEDHLGVIFAWGIFVNGAFLPGSFTYAYGFIQLITFQVPLTFILAHGVDHRFQYKVLKPDRQKTICTRIGLHLPFLLVLGIQVVMAYLFWLAYGTLAFILGPLRTWSIILAAVLWYHAIYLPDNCTSEAVAVFQLKPTPIEQCRSDQSVGRK